MRRTLAFLCLLALTSFAAACGNDESTNTSNSNATRNGVIETNANINKNLNGNTAPSNVGVLQNDNHNANTAGVSSMNGNKNANNKNANNKNANNANAKGNRNTKP